MDTFIDILLFLLIAVAVLPLLLLGLYAAASYFELQGAERILDATVQFMKVQWITGGVLNVGGGVALCMLGIWAFLHFDPLLQRVLGLLLVPFGAWRIVRGMAVLKGFAAEDDAR